MFIFRIDKIRKICLFIENPAYFIEKFINADAT